MASFTDTIVGFNPYTPQIPVDDYVRVGLIKQQQYDQGVQRVQSYIDSISGMEVVKAEHKDYLDKRVNQLQGEVSKVLSQDFSNQQLVNSVGNLTSKIASDPIMQNAQISTQRYKSGLAKMKQAQAEGKAAASNDWYYQDQAGKWLSDGDISSSFNADYTPFTDVNKKILAVIKEINPNSTLEDIPYKRGANGQIILDKDGQPSIDYAMMEKSVKGVSPAQIKMAIQASLDPNDARQLQIDGLYNYRGYDKNGMKQVTDQSYTYRLGQINDTIKSLLIDRQTNQNDPAHIQRVDAQIDALKATAEKYQSDYKKDIGQLDANPEGFKSNLYMQNWLSRFGEGFSYAQNSLTYKENPFFMAAERRRENDIKFQEFMVNKQFEAVRIGIEKERLRLDRERLDAYKMSLSLKARKGIPGADDAPLQLTGAAVREDIDMESLGRINEDSFLKETEQMDIAIDAQKMDLLAQVRPDLVHIVRNPDGKSKRYEYNVAGKNPDDIKNEAEASLMKLKDAYDKDPSGVSDGVKTYFDNLANTTQRLQNRKAAVNNISGGADRDVGTIDPALSKVKPLRITSSTGGTYDVSPAEMMNFNQKMQEIYEISVDYDTPVGRYNDAKAKELLTTPAERFMYSITKKDPSTQSASDKAILEKLHSVFLQVNRPQSELIQKRKEYTNNAVRDLVGATQPVSFPIEGFKAEDRGRVQSVIGTLLNSIEAAGKENPNPRYDNKDVAKMINKENNNNTTYSLVSKGGDSYALRLTNTDITRDPVEIDITKPQAQDLFGAGKFLDDFQAIREALQLSKSTGRWTTDVQNNGKESAFNLNNGLINKYGVKYHVEDPLKTGGLQVKLYLYDKAEQKWNEKSANFGQLLSEAQVTKMLSSLTDQQIDNLLGKQQ